MTANGNYTPGRGLPLAPPVGSNQQLKSVEVRRSSNESAGTNTHSDESSLVPAGRVGARMLRALAERLSARDREVLERVAQHRYLSGLQVQRFVFTDHASQDSAARTARRVLSRLQSWLLVRPLARRIGGVRSGSSATVWQLAPAGARLLKAEGSAYRVHEPSPRFLQHCLAVADVHLLLREHRSIEAVEDVHVSVEPDCWRRYSGSGGEARWLQPDLATTITTAEYEDHWFIEVDLGTESLPTLLRKCGQYEAYRASGQEQADIGTFPLVLWLFAGRRAEERLSKLKRMVGRSPRLTPALYRYATPDTLPGVLAGGAS